MTLGDLAEYQNGAAFKPADWENRGTPIVRIQNLTDPAKPLNRTTRQVSERHRVRNGDILVSWSATLDAFIWERGEAWLNQHIFRVVPNTELIDKRFLFLLLRHEIAALVETEHLHGSTMKHINRGPFLAHTLKARNCSVSRNRTSSWLDDEAYQPRSLPCSSYRFATSVGASADRDETSREAWHTGHSA